MIRYTVRPLGQCFWSQTRTLRQARLDAREARDAGLSGVVVIDNLTGRVIP